MRNATLAHKFLGFPLGPLVIVDEARRFGDHFFGNRAGALIFSGMGGDGSISGPQLVEAGGFIWGQTAETCACSSQPDSMRATGVVTFNGSPVELAAHLVEHVRSRVSAAA